MCLETIYSTVITKLFGMYYMYYLVPTHFKITHELLKLQWSHNRSVSRVNVTLESIQWEHSSWEFFLTCCRASNEYSGASNFWSIESWELVSTSRLFLQTNKGYSIKQTQFSVIDYGLLWTVRIRNILNP